MKRKLKKKVFYVLIIIALILSSPFYVPLIKDTIFIDKKLLAEKRALAESRMQAKREQGLLEQKRIEDKRKYDECLNKPYQEEFKNELINNLELEIDNYVEKKNLSYKFYNFKNEYTKVRKETTDYNGASINKLLSLIYLIEKSNQNEVDLDNETLKYISKYQRKGSPCMTTKKLNTTVPLRELLACSIHSSDNAAYLMLVDYIGRDKLKELNISLNMKNPYANSAFGNLNVNDVLIMLKRIKELIDLNNPNSAYLKEILDNNYFNTLDFDDVNYYYKYGMSDVYFHSAGIETSNNPYALIIMSTLRYGDYKNIFNNISKKFNNLNDLLLESQQQYCQELIYGGNNDG